MRGFHSSSKGLVFLCGGACATDLQPAKRLVVTASLPDAAVPHRKLRRLDFG